MSPTSYEALKQELEQQSELGPEDDRTLFFEVKERFKEISDLLHVQQMSFEDAIVHLNLEMTPEQMRKYLGKAHQRQVCDYLNQAELQEEREG